MSADRRQQPFRLQAEQQDRLHRAARRRGVSIQSYMHTAVLDRVEQDEAAHQRWNETRRLRRDEEGGSLPRGLGLRPQPGLEPKPTPIAAAPAPVVVNIGHSSEIPAGELARLAIYVVDGPLITRDRRMREVVEMLRPSCTSTREREDLARQLDAAVADRLKQRSGNEVGLARATPLISLLGKPR